MSDIETLSTSVNEKLGHLIQSSQLKLGELTIDVLPHHLSDVCLQLRDSPEFAFEQLIDVCGVDYLHYGIAEWQTHSATATGFERGVDHASFVEKIKIKSHEKHRYGVVYHLLSVSLNHRIRIKVLLESDRPLLPSVVSIWPSANWFEREAFDLFGIHFQGHPDLRRILTDYGFMGHPFRKDFPLIGKVEVRYDAKSKQVIYEPVSIQPRILEPKVIRHDNRYVGES